MSLVIIEKVSPVHGDDRGFITDILNETVSHIGLVTFKKGVVRGKHYHHQSTQYDYLLSGRLQLIVCKSDGTEREEHIIEAGMRSIIAPGIVHTYVALADSEMLDITTLSRDGDGYESDTIRVNIDV